MRAVTIIGSVTRLPSSASVLEGIDLLELRLDLADIDIGDIASLNPPVPLLVTYRPPQEGTSVSDTRARLEALGEILTAEHVWGVDLERSLFTDPIDPTIEEVARQVRSMAHETDTTVICSAHDTKGTMTVTSLIELITSTADIGDIGKVAVMTPTPAALGDLVTATVTLSQEDLSFTTMAMGEYALLSRVIAMEVGCSPVYGHVESFESTAPGQPSVTQLRSVLNALKTEEHLP